MKRKYLKILRGLRPRTPTAALPCLLDEFQKFSPAACCFVTFMLKISPLTIPDGWILLCKILLKSALPDHSWWVNFVILYFRQKKAKLRKILGMLRCEILNFSEILNCAGWTLYRVQVQMGNCTGRQPGLDPAANFWEGDRQPRQNFTPAGRRFGYF